jgi:microcystin-dependent protein
MVDFEIGTSGLLRTWANSGTKVNTDTTLVGGTPKTNIGWQPQEKPPSQYFNFQMNQLGQKINHCLQNGIAYWNNTTTYASGNMVTYSNDAWLCITANTNSAPNLLNSNWVRVLKNSDSASIGIVGEVRAIAHATVDTGWLLCDGSAISRVTYTNLFSRLGTLYGIGDGSTTFNLPDYRGYMLVGKLGTTPTTLTTISTNALNGNLANTLGAKMGKDTHTLSVGELAQFSVSDVLTYRPAGGALENAVAGENYDLTSRNIGQNLPHNNLPPVAVVNYIIKF